MGALSETLVSDRQAGLHAAGAWPTKPFAAFCGQLAVGWHFCARDPQAKRCVERIQSLLERSFEPGRVFADELDAPRRREKHRFSFGFAVSSTGTPASASSRKTTARPRSERDSRSGVPVWETVVLGSRGESSRGRGGGQRLRALPRVAGRIDDLVPHERQRDRGHRLRERADRERNDDEREADRHRQQSAF